MAGLTTKQKEELNQAIHEYLVKHNYLQAANLLMQEASIKPIVQNGSSALGGSSPYQMNVILERKWSSVAKLKKEVDELAKQNKLLKEQ